MEAVAQRRSITTRYARDPYESIRQEIRMLLLATERTLAPVEIDPEKFDFWIAVEVHERSLIEEALRVTSGNQKRAAELLTISPSTLSTKIRVLKIDVESFKKVRR